MRPATGWMAKRTLTPLDLSMAHISEMGLNDAMLAGEDGTKVAMTQLLSFGNCHAIANHLPRV